MLTKEKREFIEFMMGADVLRFGDFVTKSGRNTPYFVNTGNYKTGAQFSQLAKFYAKLIYETVGENFDAMFGPAYKGIVLAAGAAGALYTEHGIDKPYFYNRKEVKDHGEGGSLVGYKPPGRRPRYHRRGRYYGGDCAARDAANLESDGGRIGKGHVYFCEPVRVWAEPGKGRDR